MQLGILLIVLCHIAAWLKGHAKYIWGWELSLWTYWLTFGLATNFLGMTGWWRICEGLGNDYWRGTVITMGIGVLVTLVLNTISYGFNVRASLAIVLVLGAGLLVR